jgi:hypothetical protein
MLVYIVFGSSLYRFTVYQGCIWSPLQNLDAGILLHLYFSICSAFEWFLDVSETIPMVRFDAQLLSHSPIIPFPHQIPICANTNQLYQLCIPFCRFLNPNSCCNNLGCKKSYGVWKWNYPKWSFQFGGEWWETMKLWGIPIFKSHHVFAIPQNPRKKFRSNHHYNPIHNSHSRIQPYPSKKSTSHLTFGIIKASHVY